MSRWSHRAYAAALAIDDSGLAITLYDAPYAADGRRAPRAAAVRSARLDCARGGLVRLSAGARADASMHLPKRFSHWTVDTLRAVPWIGPGPVACLEDQMLAARDAYRRIAFWSTGAAPEVVAGEPPAVAALDTSEASVDEAHWPPPHIATIWKSPEPGEGEWAPPDVPWLRKVPRVSTRTHHRRSIAPSSAPTRSGPYAKVLLVAMDMRQLDLDMEAGVEDPEPLTGPHGSGRIPRDPAIYRRVVGGVQRRLQDRARPLRNDGAQARAPSAAARRGHGVVLDDGRVGLGTWGHERGVGGISRRRRRRDRLVSAEPRRARRPRSESTRPGATLWGFTLPGKGAQTERTGLCVTIGGHLDLRLGRRPQRDDARARR